MRRVVASLVIVGLGACAPAPTITAFRGRTMGTTFSIKVVVPPGRSPYYVEDKIQEALAAFDLVFSTYNENSEISRFNAQRSVDPVDASREFADVLTRALELADRTGGAFDPTLAPLLRAHGMGPGAGKTDAPPTDAELAALREFVGYRKVAVRPDGKVQKDHPKLELDLNAIAKGAGVDRVGVVVEESGCRSYMVEIGGEVRCRGLKPDGKPWRLGVANPADPGNPAAVVDKVDLRDRAMATSGGYYRYREFATGRVHHILDPRTGRNAKSDVVSVTVLADTCELADGLATAMMVLGPDEGMRVLATYGTKVQALFLLADGQRLARRGYLWD